MFNLISLLAENNAESAINPFYEAITTIGPYAIGIVGALGLIYAIVLGVKFSKAQGQEEVTAAKKQLVNAIIGVITIVVLLSILYAIRDPLIQWANS